MRTQVEGPETSIVLDADPDQVWKVVADAQRYPRWLVGAKAVPRVDGNWPAEGSSFSHRIGFGPLAVCGSTTVDRVERPRRLDLRAGMGPLGEAWVSFRLSSTEDGTELSVLESPSGGIARMAWRVARPMVALALWGRNALSLEMLAREVAETVRPARDARASTDG